MVSIGHCILNITNRTENRFAEIPNTVTIDILPGIERVSGFSQFYYGFRTQGISFVLVLWLCLGTDQLLKQK